METQPDDKWKKRFERIRSKDLAEEYSYILDKANVPHYINAYEDDPAYVKVIFYYEQEDEILLFGALLSLASMNIPKEEQAWHARFMRASRAAHLPITGYDNATSLFKQGLSPEDGVQLLTKLKNQKDGYQGS